ncbi:hypothetical protein CMUST_02475 [Corynebacterium mustelae]|uniref:Uncharacterized protein n=1 Tax=Corynebacterium mustelae TaxID=571915 RepID=A0A0G3GUL4_9CORY|nr:hypothetical protein [Corynebacterium mustelae]AKK04839.1 hypothetical protein CMUST_02475 [Corynebacterium mustelae]
MTTHNNRFLPLLIAAAVAVPIPVVSTAVLPTTAFAQDQAGGHHDAVGGDDNYQTTDAMPHKYFYTPVADSTKYEGEVKSFLAVSQIRHLYHTAAYNQKYANYRGKSAEEAAHDAVMHQRSEDNCYVAKARLSLAIMKYEGDVEARSLDLSKVGFDKAETEKAYTVLKRGGKATEAARDAARAAGADDKTIGLHNNRLRIFSDGENRLSGIIGELASGKATTEYDAFAVTDWEVKEDFVKCEYGTSDDDTCNKINEVRPDQRRHFGGHPLSNVAKNLDIAKVSPSDDSAAAAISASGAANRAKVKAAYNFDADQAPQTDPAPKPSEPSTTAPAPKPTDPTTSAPAPKPDTSTTTSAPAPSSEQPPAPGDKKPFPHAAVWGSLTAIIAVIAAVIAGFSQFGPQLMKALNIKF